MVQPPQLARIAASSPQHVWSGRLYRTQIENLGGQVVSFPLRGLLLRAGSRHYKYC
ncbi:MAG: hypothetical protein RIS47_1578 [Bacteroidota bacterium]